MPNITDSKCVLVVGATAGIGKSLALSILALPSEPTVIISGRRKDRLDEITKEHGRSGRLEAIQMDIDADRASLKQTVEDVLARYPKVCRSTHLLPVSYSRKYSSTLLYSPQRSSGSLNSQSPIA